VALSEQEFRLRSDEALEQARRDLMALSDEAGFEVELQNGVLNLIFDEPRETKFVVSPNTPVRQVWVSAMGRSYKLPWSAELEAFAMDREPLGVLLGRLARAFLDQPA
jgi:frataxin-like iron-binding protein CyaY